MSRWTNKIENSISLASHEKHNQDFLNAFFESAAYIPHNEQEEQELEEFSLVLSSMSLLIYVAMADGDISEIEKQRIVKDLIFQLNQRPLEYQKLAEFGKYEKEIILNIYDKLLLKISQKSDIKKICDVISMVYANNLAKRIYLIRLCYYCCYSDGRIKQVELDRIEEVCELLKVGRQDRIRVHQEVSNELNI